MNMTLRVLATTLAMLVLSGCNRDGMQLPGAVEEAQQDDRASNDPFVVAGDAGKVGAAVDGNGDISEPKVVFAPNETVYVSMDAKGRRQGDRVRVFWFHADGLSRKEEEKRIEGPFVAFDYVPTEAGRFRIAIDLNDRPIGLVDFEVQ